MDDRTTELSVWVNVPRHRVFNALIIAESIAQWMVPDGMTIIIHEFDGREGGTFRISLTYHSPLETGKTTPNTDTYHGRFVKLIPNEQVIEVVEFETADPLLQGEMTITFTLTDKKGGTEILAVHDNLPPGLSTEDNETGWRTSLSKLTALLEAKP